MASIPTLITSQPGIRRDGTRLESQNYSDGQWVRFDDDKPRKMGGYLNLSDGLLETSRGLHSASVAGATILHSGSQGLVQQVRINQRAGTVEALDRTPSGFVANDDYVWSFDNIFDVIDGKWKLVAHAATTLDYLDDPTKTTVYIGDLNSANPLISIKEGSPPVDFKVAGGICCVHPFLFAFDNDGRIIWSVSNKPSNVTDTFNTGTNVPAGEVRPTGKKVVAARAMKGLGVPAGLFWSLDQLVRGAYVGGSVTWDFDELATIEILSARSIVEYNGAYFWLGGDRFISFAGQVQDVKNPFNKRWFFRHLTKGHEGKIFGFANPGFGEIWWCAPMFGATEPNHAIVFNVNNGTWYDTPLPGAGRSAAASPTSTYRYPVMAELPEPLEGRIRLWQHERGVNEIDGSNRRAVRSYYVTGDITMLRSDKPADNAVEVLDLEPDFVQSGDLTVTVYGNANSRAPTIIGRPVTIPAPGPDLPSGLETIELRDEHRQMRFRFESNTVGGDYEAGATYAHIQLGSARTQS